MVDDQCVQPVGKCAESPQTLPIVDPHRCALLPEHRGQKRNREIPQLTNAKIHRHRVTLGIHATPSIYHPRRRLFGGTNWKSSGIKVEK